MVTRRSHHAEHYGQSCFHNNLHCHLYFARMPNQWNSYRNRHREPGANRYGQLGNHLCGTKCNTECYAIYSWWNLFMVAWWSHHAEHCSQPCFHDNLHCHLYFARMPDKRDR